MNYTYTHRVMFGAILMVHAGILIHIAAVTSPSIDELAHLSSGIVHWDTGSFNHYRVNPPLVRMVAAFPVMFFAEHPIDVKYTDSAHSRPEFLIGKSFVKRNQSNIFGLFTIARIACMPFSIIGCLTAYCWARQLYGQWPGLAALAMYAFSPNLLAWGASITPDAASASMCLLALWTFQNWLNSPTLKSTILSGLCLGVSLLTKTIWIFLIPLYLVFWAGYVLLGDAKAPRASQLCVLLTIGIYTLNLGYGFEGTMTSLGDYNFGSRTLSGCDDYSLEGNRFSGSSLGNVPIPLPRNFVRGIDLQKSEFECGKWSYLRGHQKKGGWWYYYFYAFLVKTPVGFMLVLVTMFASMRSISRSEFLILVLILFLFGLVSSQTGFSRYYRYVIAAIPLICILASRVFAMSSKWTGIKRAALAALLLSVTESVAVTPHSMSFFNVLAGGPANGGDHLLDANIDWGQDLLFLRKWKDRHPDAGPFHVAYFSEWDFPPRVAGIDCANVPRHTNHKAPMPTLGPGWYAISVNYVYGLHYFEDDHPDYAYFRRLQPSARVGYSILVYHVE